MTLSFAYMVAVGDYAFDWISEKCKSGKGVYLVNARSKWRMTRIEHNFPASFWAYLSVAQSVCIEVAGKSEAPPQNIGA